MLRLDEYLNGANIQTHYGFNLIILGIFSQNLYHYLIAFYQYNRNANHKRECKDHTSDPNSPIPSMKN